MSLALMSSLSGYFSGEYLLYTVVLLLFIPVTIAGIVAQVKVDSTFRKCNVPASCGLTAAQIARRMLDANGLTNVQVVRIGGHLTDNYNPVTKVLSLSQSVYGSTSVSAIGVACHEACALYPGQEQNRYCQG